jgi:DNA-directed RNA polymerase specialized sigma24 family protein
MPDAAPSGDSWREADDSTQVFVEHRELLFSIVYNVLGIVADTEDVLQEAWLSWVSRNETQDAQWIDNPRAYLVRTTVNAALARQASIRRRREKYIGPWLPEPLVTAHSDQLTPVGGQVRPARQRPMVRRRTAASGRVDVIPRMNSP